MIDLSYTLARSLEELLNQLVDAFVYIVIEVVGLIMLDASPTHICRAST